MPRKKIAGLAAITLGVMILGALPALGMDAPSPEQAAIAQTPPRLSLTDGQVSFWRPGASDWAQAQVNTPLAPGDELYTGSPGTLEVQAGARAFVRGWADTQLGLENQEPDFLQFKLTVGHASIDLRSLEAGHTLELDTPNGAFTIERPGYYRVDVAGDQTIFIARRAGQATLTPSSGQAVAIGPDTEVVVQGTSAPQIASYAAPPLDTWDTWNYARTDQLLAAQTGGYLSPDVYGAGDLERYGTWRAVPTYGSVWVPNNVPPDWVPYSTGAWILDPVYGWTWVSSEPWGWAPFHYGRWVFVDGFWAWAPGPILARPAYAPALVAFYGASGGVGLGGPAVGWVALGWGEPCVPWWGPTAFRRHPWWGGWGGPHVVNNVVVNRTTVVNVQHLTVYRNAAVRNAVVVVNEDHFGHGRITRVRAPEAEVRSFRPIHTPPHIAAAPASFVPTASRGVRPPEQSLRRAVVATRPPRGRATSPSFGEERNVRPAGIPAPAPHLVSRPQGATPPQAPPRPAVGPRAEERPLAPRGQASPSPAQEAPRPYGGASASPPPPAGPPRLEPKVIQPAPARRPEGPPSPADHGRFPTPPRPEGTARLERTPAPPPVARQSRPEPKVPGASPSTPQASRAPALPPAPVRQAAPPPVAHQAPAPPRTEPRAVGIPQPASSPPPRRPEGPPVEARPQPAARADHVPARPPEARPAAPRERTAPSAPVPPRGAPENAQ